MDHPAWVCLLAAHPEGFDDDTGRQLMRESKSIERADLGEEPDVQISTDLSLAPDERVDAAVQELCRAVAAELLDRIHRMPPALFEGLVLDLLHALGYGSRDECIRQRPLRIAGPRQGLCARVGK